MMKILFIAANHNPFDKQMSGAMQRTSLLLDACAQMGEVDVVVFREEVVSDREHCKVVYSKARTLVEDLDRGGKFKKLLRPWDIRSFYPAVEQIEKELDVIIAAGQYDLIVVRYLPKAVSCGLMKYADRLVVDVDDNPSDVEMALAKQAKTWRAKMYHMMASLQLRWATRRALAKVRYSFFPNAEQVYKKNSAYLPNIPFYEQSALEPAKENHQVMFVGDLRYEPNYMGVGHFVEKIWPEVLKQVPDAKLRVVGKYNDGWDGRVLAMSDERIASSEAIICNSVSILGFVEDLVEEYRQAQVCVVPVYTGAGTNIKVLEALQMGRACVTTKVATRGFDATLRVGEDYLMAESDEAFVQHVVRLLTDSAYNWQLAARGSESVRAHYSREEFMNIVDCRLKIGY